jgi:hypothetical protein
VTSPDGTSERWGLKFSGDCPNVKGLGYACMVCEEPATGHAAVEGGHYDGRCVALLCAVHASPDGWTEFKMTLLRWGDVGLLDADGGPGPLGTPEAWHGDHWDPMPECAGGDE